MERAANELRQYLHELGNHKLDKLEDSKGFAIIRKSKTYAFSMDFDKVIQMGFRFSHMQSFNNKDEIIIFYIGN